MITALISKDIKLFFRNPFFAVITLLGLLFFIAVFYLLPGTVEDSVSTALALPNPTGQKMADFLGQVLESDVLPHEDALIDAVERGEYKAGLVLGDDVISAIQIGEKAQVTVYLTPGASPDLHQAVKDIYTVGLNSLCVLDASTAINIDEEIVVLGADYLGIMHPISMRDRMLPLFLLMVFSIELMGMANLISDEIEKNTVQALMVTPLSIGQFFLSKAMVGILMAFLQVFLMVAAAGKFMVAPLMITIILILASIMFTGLAFVIASLARDMLSVLAWSTLILLMLIVPGMGVVFPVMAADWVRAVPSFYVVDSLHRVLNFDAGWMDLSGNLIILTICGLLLLAGGVLLLRRRFR